MVELQIINSNLKYVKVKQIPHKTRNEIIYHFIGIRNNYFITNVNHRQRNFIEIIKVIKSLIQKNLNFIFITELDYVNLISRVTFIQKNEWIPGFLLRFYGKPYLEKIKKFPAVMICISNTDRSIPILEAKRLNILSFLFTSLNKESFILSDYKLPISFNKKYFTQLATDIILSNITLKKYLKNKYFNNNIANILHRVKLENIYIHNNIIKKLYKNIKKKADILKECNRTQKYKKNIKNIKIHSIINKKLFKKRYIKNKKAGFNSNNNRLDRKNRSVHYRS